MASLTRFLLAGVTVFALFHAVSAFMCYTKELGDDSSSVSFCNTGTCFSVGAGVGDAKATRKGCADTKQEDGCVTTGVPGIASAHMCYCSFPLCNDAFTPKILLPLLVLPALVQYFL